MGIEKEVEKTLEKESLDPESIKDEKIIVALSGGKDSAVTAYILKKLGYNIEGLYIDLGVGRYSEDCLKAVKKLSKILNIKLHVYDLKQEQGKTIKHYWSQIKSQRRLTTCSICGVFKKWILNKKSRELGGGKIATGHNLDDEAQTVLINFFKGSLELSENAGVITKNLQENNKGKFIPRIKPLFYIPEKNILKYARSKKLPIVEGNCPYAEESYRIQVRKFLSKTNQKEKQNILKNFNKLTKNHPNSSKSKSEKIVNFCKKCGEPAKGELCKRCELIEISKNNQKKGDNKE